MLNDNIGLVADINTFLDRFHSPQGSVSTKLLWLMMNVDPWANNIFCEIFKLDSLHFGAILVCAAPFLHMHYQPPFSCSRSKVNRNCRHSKSVTFTSANIVYHPPMAHNISRSKESYEVSYSCNISYCKLVFMYLEKAKPQNEHSLREKVYCGLHRKFAVVHFST